MMRITQLATAAATKAYYRVSDYFLGEQQERPGVVFGKGAAMLGLEVGKPIDKLAFDRLCENRHPLTGEKLTDPGRRDHADRRTGWDMNFHNPKGLSIARQVLGDERLDQAHDEAVRYAMSFIEADMKTRVRKGGQNTDRVVGNVVGVAHRHTTSRPVKGEPDPHDHTHMVIFNDVFDPVEGQWKAAEIGDIKRHAGYYEAIFHARLAQHVAALGYGIQRKGKYWDIAGIDDPLLKKFSRRMELIEKVAAEKGITNETWKSELGAKTRERKADHLTPDQLRDLWRNRLTPEEASQLANLPGQLSPLPSSVESARFAIDHGFEREAVVNHKRILEHGLRHGVGSIDLDSLKTELDRAGLLVKGERSTTREMLDLEAGMFGWAASGRGTVMPVAESQLRTTRVAESKSPIAFDKLNPGQSRAVKHILTSQDRVTLVRGAAGTGKTFALKVAADGIRQAGFPVQAIAPTSKATEELQTVDPGAATLARFLVDTKLQELSRGGVVIMDEASLTGARQMAQFFGVLQKIDARAVLVGDIRQHAAVTAGSPFRLLQEHAGLPVAEITEVMRQHGLYKWVSERLSRHDIDGGLDLLEQMGHVHEAEYAERMRLIAQDYWEAVSKGKSVLVVAPTHAEGDSVTGIIRERLKQEGKVKDDEKEFTRLVPLNLTEAERGDERSDLAPGAVAVFSRDCGGFARGQQVQVSEMGDVGRKARNWAAYRPETLSLATGDAIRITANGKDKSGKHKLKNGSVYTVSKFDRHGDIVLNNGWVLDKEFGHLAHGYVSTSHASQGRTVDVVLVSESTQSFPAAGREQLYVSLSRGKQAAYLYTDDYAGLKEAVQRSQAKENATDVFDQSVQVHEKVSPTKDRLQFMNRIKGMAQKAVQKVRQLTHKEKRYELEIG